MKLRKKSALKKILNKEQGHYFTVDEKFRKKLNKFIKNKKYTNSMSI